MKKVLKITKWIAICIILLLFAAIIALNTPWGQNYVRNEAEVYLRGKIKTEVHIGHLGYGLPKFIVLSDVLILDQLRDTLLSVNTLKIDLLMLELLHKKLDVQLLVLKGVHAHVYRNMPDTNFNFTYIIDAFAGTPKGGKSDRKPKDSSTSAFSVAVGRVEIDDIHARFDDQTGGTALAIGLEHLSMVMKKTDIDKIVFHVKELTVAGLQGTFAQDTSYLPPSPDVKKKASLQLIADKVHLERINFDYNDNLNKLLFALNLGGLDLELRKFDLQNNNIDINRLAIANSSAMLTFGKNSGAHVAVDTVVKKDTTGGWHVRATQLDLSGLSFKMDNANSPKVKKGIDYAHLDLKELSLNLHGLTYTSDSISGNVQHLALQEQSGVNLKEFKTIFTYNEQGVVLNNLYLLTPHTQLRDHLEAHYSSVGSLKEDPGQMKVNVDLSKSLIGFDDVLIFAPQLASQDIFRKYPKGQIRVDARLTGSVNNMNISRLYVLSMNNSEIELNGRMTGLPVAEKLKYNLHITKLESSRKEIDDLAPHSALDSIRLPDRFGITGDVLFTIKDYYADLMIVSTDGNAYVKGSLALSPGKNRERYNMLVQTNKLNIGRILKPDTLLGEITAAVTVVGTGFDIKTMNTAVTGAIGSAVAKDYRYHDVVFSGEMVKGKGAITLSSADNNLRLHMKGSADLSGKTVAAKLDMQLDSIDFQALHLYKTELRARGIIHADFPSLDLDYPRGTFTWTQPVINADGKRYYLDSMYIVSAPDESKGQDITAYFEVLSAHITGKTPLRKIGSVIEERINRQYTSPAADTAAIAAKAAIDHVVNKKPKDTAGLPESYDLKLTASITDRPMLHSILPGLTGFDSIHIDGTIDERSLTFNANAPYIVYGSNTVSKAIIKISGSDSAFTYKVTVDKLSSGGLSLWYADIHGSLEHNLVTATLTIADSLKKERFALAASMQRNGGGQVINLKEGLKLNYQNWDVNKDNRIVLANNGFYVQNFEIRSAGQYIKANSESPSADAPLKVDITNFLLSTVTGIANVGDTVLANGVLGAIITTRKTSSGREISGDLEILSLSVMGDTLGNLKALVDNNDENTLNAKLALTGNGNDISLDGAYYLQSKNGNDFDMQLDMKAMALRSFEALAQKQIKNSSGYLRGNLHVTGTPAAPLMNGELKTDNMRTTVSALNAAFKFPSEKLKVADNLITLTNFTILDSPDNRATFNGTINIKEIAYPVFDLNVKAKNWKAVHSTVKDNKDFYGDLVLTTNLDVKGTVESPVVDGSLNILKGTNFTIVTPEKTPEVESRLGIVKFVNGRDSSRPNVLVPKKKDSVAKHKLAKGSDINVNVVVDKSAQFSLIIDQASGDFISVRGDATLNASISPNGTIALAGNYALHDGAYQLNYNFIKRKFLIKDGSVITFAGDPIDGTNMDVTAVYEANIPPYDLVQRQVQDQAALNYFKQRIPFDIDLHLRGPVLKPGIFFDINLPDGKVYPLSSDQLELIQGKLSQVRTDTSELNKQVFAVLILNRFVSDDPFRSDASSSAGFTALQSVSTFIGEQLNQAANKIAKGIDFSVDLATTEDYTSGDLRQRTDLSLAASKQLFDDRLKLTIGNDFELDGPQTSNQQTSYIPTNLAADYLLSADGKYTLRGYRRAYDEGVLLGYVTETGLNFIVSLDYDKFKSIIKKRTQDSTSSK